MLSDKRRFVSLIGSVVIALSAGSTYVFSSYAPQVQHRLHLSGMQINVLALASNIGLYISGPPWGGFVDKHGAHGAILSGALCALVGYGLLSLVYAVKWVDAPVSLLSLFMFLTGIGNQAGLCGAINVQAKSWNGRHRGTAMAVVLSAFGLSAFMYSTVSRIFFSDNVGGYLAVLAVGSCASFFIGALMVRIVPPDERALAAERAEHDHEQGDAPPRPISRRRRSSSDLSGDAYAYARVNRNDPDRGDPYDDPSAHDDQPSGVALLTNLDFMLLFVLLGLISGSGLVLINNVGVITNALWDYNKRVNRVPVGLNALVSRGNKLQQVQATQVSLISIGNASGRIIIGFLSDFLVRVTDEPHSRSLLLLLVAFLALISQVVAAWPDLITNVNRLKYLSGLTGVMYGTLFGLCPVLVFEWFGMPNFSQNWGWMGWGPVIAGNVFNLLFGYIYDSHVSRKSHSHICHLGDECYRSVFFFTSFGCLLAVVFAAVLIGRHSAGVFPRIQQVLSRIFIRRPFLH